MTIRERIAAVAGSFYPSDPDDLARTVDALLAAADPPGPVPRAIVAPHAGYVYSGPVAATAYASLRPRAEAVRRVVLLGPSHFEPLAGMAVPTLDAWLSPLGEVALDDGLRTAALAQGAAADDLPHAREHALETQLPFLQRLLAEGFTILPIAVGDADAGEVADVVAHLWDGVETLVVVSSDLSHYLTYEKAREVDAHTAQAVLRRDPHAISSRDACGAAVLRGLVEHARRRHLPVRLLDLRSSGDTAGGRDRVVGYGAFAVG